DLLVDPVGPLQDGRPDADGRPGPAEAGIRDFDCDRADVGALEGVDAGEASEEDAQVGRAGEQLLLELDEARQVEEERIVADAGEALAPAGDVRDPEGRALVRRGRAVSDGGPDPAVRPGRG